MRGVLNRVVTPVVRLLSAGPEQPHYFDGFLQHLKTLGSGRPRVTEDVFVEVLSGAHSQEEPARKKLRAGGRSLSNDRRMKSDRRTSYSGTDPEPLRRL